MYSFNFIVTDQSHATDEPAPESYGQTIFVALQLGLTKANFDCGLIELKNSVWQFETRKNGTCYLLHGQAISNTGCHKAQICVSHKRNWIDWFLNRYTPAPQNYIEKTMRDILLALPGMSDLSESQSFQKFDAARDTFAKIRQ